jgi:hypothetical protein
LVEAKEAIRNAGYKRPKRKYRKKPTEQEKRIAYSYAAYGATNEDIAAVLGMDNKTLTKYFEKELISGRAVSKNTIAERLYKMAVGREAVIDPASGIQLHPAIAPDRSALIFLAKVRLGWKETAVVEQTVDVKSSEVKFYIPDNGMRCEGET